MGVAGVAGPSVALVVPPLLAGWVPGGVGAYWIADPVEPSVTMIRWEDGDEHEQVIVGLGAGEAPHPFPVSVNPQSLIDD